MDKKLIWLQRLGWGIAIWGILEVVFVVYGHAQVTTGTVNSKTLDGVGNKITSTIVGPDIGLDINCLNCGAGGSTYLDADGIVNQTASAVHGQTYMYNGVTWDRVRGTIAGGLQVNCITGCAGGSTTPSDAFANPTTAGLQMGFNMIWNGATWDRWAGNIGTVTTLTSITNPVVIGDGTNSIVVFSAGLDAASNANNQLNTAANVYGYNGVSWDRMRGTIAGGLLVDVSDAFLLDATFTGRFPAAYVDADAIANQTSTAVHGQLYGYNGVTWDRLRGSAADGLLVNLGANNDVTVTSGSITATNAFLLDATYTGRMPAGASPADNESNTNTALSRIGVFNYVFDGVAWDRWTGAVSQSGTWNVGTVTAVTSITNPVAVTGTFFQATQPVSIAATVTVQGAKTNDNAAPGATNVGVLPCIATAVAPAYTEGNQVGCSTTLTGDTRSISKTVTLSATGQQAVTAVATALPANSGREVCIKVVSSGTQTVFYGIAGVTTATGQELLPGEKFCAPVSNSSQFVVIAGGAGSTVSFEVYN